MFRQEYSRTGDVGRYGLAPDRAGIVGASNLVPKDRPIDGSDASAFLLGKSNNTGRESYMLFGPGLPVSGTRLRSWPLSGRHDSLCFACLVV